MTDFPKAETTDDIDNLEPGQFIWIKVEVVSVDSDGEVSLQVPYIVERSDAANPHSPLQIADWGNFSVYIDALKWARGEQTAPLPGDIVYSQNSPGAFGKLMTTIKGQGVIDWSYDNPNAPAALSTLSMGVIRRQGE